MNRIIAAGLGSLLAVFSILIARYFYRKRDIKLEQELLQQLEAYDRLDLILPISEVLCQLLSHINEQLDFPVDVLLSPILVDPRRRGDYALLIIDRWQYGGPDGETRYAAFFQPKGLPFSRISGREARREFRVVQRRLIALGLNGFDGLRDRVRPDDDWETSPAIIGTKQGVYLSGSGEIMEYGPDQVGYALSELFEVIEGGRELDDLTLTRFGARNEDEEVDPSVPSELPPPMDLPPEHKAWLASLD